MLIKERLKRIAEMVEEDVVIDVGCDHALLDIYLVKEKGKKAIASDCNVNAYQIAKTNIEKHHLKDQIQLYLTDGTKNIPISENSTLVIAGMGSSTMIEILKNTPFLPKQLILQSNNDLDLLRKYVVSRGYYIDQEEVVIEKKIYNVIISFKKGNVKYDKVDYEIGPLIRRCKKEEERQYLEFLLANHESILKQLPQNQRKRKKEESEIINDIKNELNK